MEALVIFQSLNREYRIVQVAMNFMLEFRSRGRWARIPRPATTPEAALSMVQA